jgi:putative ABC transport system permease protein
VILLRLISWPYIRKHVLRTALTATGIVLGVAVFVGMHTADESVLFAFNTTIDRIAGKTELQVTAGETGFGEDVLDRVQTATSVRVAVPVIEVTVDSELPSRGSLLILGIDMTGDRSLRDYDLDSGDEAVIDDPLVFLAKPDSIILTKEFADRNHLASGDKFPLGTVLGRRDFTVRGIMKPSGLSSAFGSNIAIMDIYAAQRMFGRGRMFDRIDLALKPGVALTEGQRELAGILGPGFEVEPPSSRGQHFESMTAAYSMMVNISSLFALFIGMFIIYNAFAIAVTQRRSEIGILRALGATRGQIRTLFLVESAVIGVIGSIGGLAVGLLIARGIAASIGQLISDVYGVAQHADQVAASPSLLAIALGIGVVTSIVAALIPARQAARVDPVQALQKGKYQVLSAGESRLRLVLAALLAVVAAAALIVPRVSTVLAGSRAVSYVGYVLTTVGVLLLGPMLSLGLARALRPFLKGLRPVEGALAADSLIQAPRRTSASVAALMLSLSLVVGFAGMARASYNSIIEWMDTTLNPDLILMPTRSFVTSTIRFPPEVVPEVAALPGVRAVRPVRNARITFRKTQVLLVAVDIKVLAATSPQQAVSGNLDDMYARTAAGQALIVSDNLAQMKHLTVGDTIEVPAPDGIIQLPIAGTLVDYSDQQGTILMDRALFTAHWRDDTVNAVGVFVTPGTQPADVSRRILDRLAGRQAFVLTNGEIRAYILKVTDQWFGLTSIQIAVAVLVAILGIVNTLTVSITDRRRELGVLQAVGGLRSQVRRAVWMEALSIGVLGLLLGLALGAVNLYYILEIVQRDIAGLRLDYVFPLSVALALVPTILASAFVAAIWPAESVVRGSLVEALEYE